MKQQLRIPTLFTNRLWLVGLMAAALLLVAQQAHADEEAQGIVYANMPQQFVDLDGDGQRESFSGTLAVYEDGTAVGQFLLGSDHLIELQTGTAHCVAGTAVAQVQGSAFQNEGGVLIEIGTVTLSARAADGWDGIHDDMIWDIVDSVTGEDGQNNAAGNGGGGLGDDIIWDIVDSVAVAGSLNFTANPCAPQN